MIRGDVWVDSGVVLTIEPGVNVRFIPDYDYEHSGIDTTRAEFIVQGDLHLLGSDSIPVVFTSNDVEPDTGDWYGIRYETPDSSLTVEYLTVQYTVQGLSYALNKPFKVRFCEIAFCNIGINSASKFTKITDTEFTSNNYGAIINDGFLNMVKRCEFTGNVTGLLLKGGDDITHPVSNETPLFLEGNLHPHLFKTPLLNPSGIASPVCVRTPAYRPSGAGRRTGRHKLSIEDELAMTQQHKGFLYNANEDQNLLFQISPSPGSSPVKGEEIERRMAISLAPEGKFQLALVYDNIFQSNDTGIVFSDCAVGMVRKNDVTNNLIGVYITDNAWPFLGIGMSGQNLFIVPDNTPDSLQNYAVYNNTSNYILAEGNWWGTNSVDSIAEIIYDYYDAHNLGKVDFKPFRKYNSKGGEGTMESSIADDEDSKFKFEIPAIVKGDNFKISLTLPQKMVVSIVIYDISGRECKELHLTGIKGKKEFRIESGLSQGVYFVMFKAKDYSTTKKVILLR